MNKYDGWAIKTNWNGEIIPWSFQRKRTEVVEWWNEWSLATDNTFKWKNFRKRGTHKIVKVKIVEVEQP